jgi:hypothetical protein
MCKFYLKNFLDCLTLKTNALWSSETLKTNYTAYHSRRLELFIIVLVSYECETWSLTLQEDCKLGVFGNQALRRIFGCKLVEVAGSWTKWPSNLYIYQLLLE